jgi:hypothetical protein
VCAADETRGGRAVTQRGRGTGVNRCASN